ncbi:MAG: PilZ domain-containing protein [Terriglobales bacterium]
MSWDLNERRTFDRVPIPATANIFADDEEGNRLGRVRMIGRGGFLLETNRRFPPAEVLLFTIIAERDNVRRQVYAEQRYTSPNGHVGFEFRSLDPEATVEIGVLIRKYFAFSGEDEERSAKDEEPPAK